jgi:hypothetical protein
MKFGYLSKKSHYLEKLRNSYIMNAYGYSLMPKISITEIIIVKPRFFYIDDHISFIELVKILLSFYFKFIDKVVLRCSELYTIDYHAYSTEVDNYLLTLKDQNKNTIINKIWSIRVYFKIWIFRLILNNKNTILFLPSVLRKEYFDLRSNFKNTTIVLRNLPMADELNFTKISFSESFDSKTSDILNSKNFFLLAGRINSFEDLVIISEYSNKNNTPIVIASDDTTSVINLKKIFPNNILFIGMVDHNVILNLVYNCSAGIILYNNQTVNQRLSASSKLFEFLYFNKPVIVSDNQGVIYELNAESYPHRILINKDLLYNDFLFTADNAKFHFENEVSSLNNLLSNCI